MALIHGATLNANVNPNGADTTVIFEYGLDTNYGTVVNVPNVIPGEPRTATPVSADITGLEQLTTYHFRVSATNSVGTSVGEDITFTTLVDPPAAPIVTTEPATNVG